MPLPSLPGSMTCEWNYAGMGLASAVAIVTGEFFHF